MREGKLAEEESSHFLPHLPVVALRDSGYDSQSDDSLVAETVVITSEAEAEPEAPVRPQGVWPTGRYATAPFTSNNSIYQSWTTSFVDSSSRETIRTGGRSVLVKVVVRHSSRTAVPRSTSVEDQRSAAALGYSLSIHQSSQPITSLNILSIDWHQVLRVHQNSW